MNAFVRMNAVVKDTTSGGVPLVTVPRPDLYRWRWAWGLALALIALMCVRGSSVGAQGAPALTELPAAQCHAVLSPADFHCYANANGWVLAKTRPHAELAAADVARLDSAFVRYFAHPAPRFAVVVDTNVVTTAEVTQLRAWGAQGAIPWPIDPVFERLGVMTHELGHLYFFVAFPSRHAAAWLKEVAAILMERPASRRARYRTLAWMLQAPRRDAMLIPLARLFTTSNPGHPGGNADDATMGVQRGMEISGTLSASDTTPTRDTAPRPFVPPASGVYSAGTVFYAECGSLIDFLIETSGDSSIFRVMTEQAERGTQMDAWLQRAGARYHLPASVAALDRAWRRWLDTSVAVQAGLAALTAEPARLQPLSDVSDRSDPLLTGRLSQTPASAGLQPVAPFVPMDQGPFVYVPPQCVGRRQIPLVILLHGAQMNGLSMLTVDDNVFQMAADWFGFILVAPKSTRSTWQLALGRGAAPAAEVEDRRRLADAVHQVMHHYDIDPARIALAGVSDGATTALILGYVNGDRLSRVLALSPGLELGDLAPFTPHGKPLVFIAHGDQDEVLPIANTRAIVSWLRRAGYQVTYTEDHEHHYLTKERAIAALQWLSASWPHPGPESACGL